ncbi:N-acetylneuraminate lyase [Lactococcus lactis subsp. lactis]|uniref:dihydrodipicolinate synthase family protein n=1 Tax=Lactococcus lactis TaxID=1358 RepID=UPI00071D2871|nr:dihydrodipicolinate synthase family protein [Lactococcus lactis]KST91476.1 N-acetylneuraminate lyase [Lactococcus lactis subsp. lactis]
MENKLSGVFVPNITVFNQDGTVNYSNMVKHIQWMENKGVNGFFVLGSYGLSTFLSLDEKINILKYLRENTSSFYIIQVGDNDIDNAVKLAKVSESLGYTHISAVAPNYYTYSKHEVINYYKRISEATGQFVYAYNNPYTTGVDITSEMLEELKEVGVAGLKDSTGNVELYLKCKELNLDYILGTSKNWPLFNLLGAKCMIAGMCNYAPEVIVNLYQACAFNDIKKIEKYYHSMLNLNISSKGINSTVLSNMGVNIREIVKSYPKYPFDTFDENSKEYQLFKENILKEVEIN